MWDEGITTPFGIQITAMAAQTQALMFPGQYQDLETTGAGVTLSHNWHRTYDPMLGRYLQSDPIGLAGGLNRYAYVGGNPVSLVDPTGEIAPLLVLGVWFGVGVLSDLLPNIVDNINNNRPWDYCLNYMSAGLSGIQSALPALRIMNGAKNLKLLSNIRKFDLPGRANQAVVKNQLGNLRKKIIQRSLENRFIDKSVEIIKSGIDEAFANGVGCHCKPNNKPIVSLRGRYNF